MITDCTNNMIRYATYVLVLRNIVARSLVLLQWKHKNAFLCVCCQLYKNTNCSTIMFLWQMYVTGNNKTYNLG
jgi:hypothetical protein